MAGSIHSTAIIDSHAHLGDDVSVGPYAIVEAEVTIGAGVRLSLMRSLRNPRFLGRA